MSALAELGISREDIIDKCVEKVLDQLNEDDSSVFSEVRRLAVNAIIEEAKPKIDGILDQALAGLVDAEFTPVDEWGQPIRKKSTTLRALVKERANAFLGEQVNSDGKTCSYQTVGSRAEWIAKKAATDAITWDVKQEITKAVETAKAEIKSQLAKHIAETMLKK